MKLTSKLALAFAPFIILVGLLALIALGNLDRIMKAVGVPGDLTLDSEEGKVLQWAIYLRAQSTVYVDSSPDEAIRWFADQSFDTLARQRMPAALTTRFETVSGNCQRFVSGPDAFAVADRDTLGAEVFTVVDELVVEAWSMKKGQLSNAPEYEAQLDRTFLAITVIFFVVALAAAAISFFIVYALVSPLKKLTRWVDAIGQGEKADAPLPSSRTDEIGFLERAFSGMISAQRQKLEDGERLGRMRLEMLNGVLEGLPFPAFILAMHDQRTLSNPAARDLGMHEVDWLSPDSADGKNDAINGEFIELLQNQIAQVRKSQKPLQHFHVSEAQLIIAGNEERYLLTQVIPVLAEDEGAENNLSGIVVLFPDVTLLHLAYELKTNTLATVSHELKTPLTSLRLALSLLQDSQTGPLNEKQDRVLNLAQRDLEKLLGVIDDIVSFSRLEDAADRLDRAEVTLGKVFESAIDQVESISGSRVFETDLSTHAASRSFYLDHGAFSQAIAHLCNAMVDTAGPRQRPIKIATADMPDGSVRIELEMKDHGLSPDQLLAWKEPSHGRYLSRSERPGLGLLLAREIIEAHGAEFAVVGEESLLRAVITLQPTNPGSTAT